jgi:tRNA (guanine37-N1)-methyltransferase
MRIDIFTIFPQLISDYCGYSILKRAQDNSNLTLKVWDIRQGAEDSRKSVDDAPLGGGSGMVLKCEPIFNTVLQAESEGMKRPLFVLSAAGHTYNQDKAKELAKLPGFSLICGRYEGIDQRVVDHLADDTLSIGDYVLSGGELAALIIVESVVRLIPGVLGNNESLSQESFEEGLLEYPHYTRPFKYGRWQAPELLVSGNHEEVASWRKVQSIVNTLKKRPDLIEKKGGLTESEVRMLSKYGYSSNGDRIESEQELNEQN